MNSHPVSTLFHRRHGPITEDLVLQPGNFGLGQIPARLQPDATTTLVCGFCSTGCGLKAHLREGSAINLTPDPDYPVNLGMACPKGWEALAPLDAPDRATTPLLRDRLTGAFSPVSWETAAERFCGEFRRIRETHGPEAAAFLSTGQIVTEEMALLGALFKFGMGFVHCDSNTRQCMATSATAYKESFGFDAPPFAYSDFEQSDVLVFVGANPCIAHPIMWQRVLRNPRKPQIIVVDPRATETAMAATQHYAIRPRSDLLFLYGIAHLLFANGWIDAGFVEAHTVGADAFRSFLADYTPDRVAEGTGIPRERLLQLARTIGTGGRVSFWWTMGVNQGHESTRTAQALINLALLTGNIGKPGTGANSITGQCNAMGSRLFGNVTSLLGGHEFTHPEHRAKVASILQIDPSLIPSQASRAYDQILEDIDSGKIRALWVIATNSVHSWINHGRLRSILAKLDFLVVQDLYHSTETAQIADLILPAAGWGEKEGTFINSERRIGLVKKVRHAPGQALADFQIFRLLAHAWGCQDLFKAWSSPEAAFQILKRLSQGQPCDFSGIRDYAHLDAAGGIQWPLPEGSPSAPEPERRLFEDGRFFFPDQRARMVFEAPRPEPEPPDADYPFVLLTGRGSSAQWHTLSRTSKSACLRSLAPEHPWIEIHPEDAEHLGISPHAAVCIRSRRGATTAAAFVTNTVQRGQVFLPMHFPGVNQLTFPAFDPYSRQPSYKSCAVSVIPVTPQPGSRGVGETPRG